MFPTFNLEEIEQQETVKRPLGRAFKFDFDNNKYVIQDGKLVEISQVEAVKQFVSWTLKTIVKKFEIYDESYGMEYSFIGNKSLPLGFINSELQRQIKEQLTAHPLVNDIEDFRSEREGSFLKIYFTVITDFEDIEFNESVVII